jgi:hypothetical protein
MLILAVMVVLHIVLKFFLGQWAGYLLPSPLCGGAPLVRSIQRPWLIHLLVALGAQISSSFASLLGQWLRPEPGAALAVLILISGCSSEVKGQPEPRVASDERVAAGRRLMASYGCGSCHSIHGVPGADSQAAPPLDRFYQRTYIAGRLPNTEESLQLDPGPAAD